jgi:hypothetical protein
MKSMRYSFCSDMSGKIPKGHLNYLMGHKPNVFLTETTYQVPDRQVNSSGIWFDESLDTSIGDFHSSVACGRDKGTLDVPDQVLYNSHTMRILINAFKEADAKVFKKHKMSSFDLEVCSHAVQPTISNIS